MTLLDRLSAPFHGLKEWQEQRTEEVKSHREVQEAKLRERRVAAMRDLMEEFSDATKVQLRRYRDLSVGETRMGNIPAIDYFHGTGAVHLYNLMTIEQLRRAALVKALAMPLDDIEDAELPEIYDVKAHEVAPIEHGAINLGPADVFKDAEGTRWRFYVELTYSGAEHSFRGGLITRKFVAEGTL